MSTIAGKPLPNVIIAAMPMILLTGLVGIVYRPIWIVAMLALGAVIAFRSPGMMLALLAVSVPVQAAFVVDIAGSPFTITKLVIVCLAIGWLPRIARAHIPVDRVTWGYASILVALVASVVAVQEELRWASIVYQWAVAVFVYIVARTEVRTIRTAQVIVGSMALAVVGISMVAFRQVLAEDGPPSFVVNGVLRAYGTFGEPNPLAAYLELSIPLLLAIVALNAVSRHRAPLCPGMTLLLVAATIFGTVALLLTQSRGGGLGFMAACMVIVAMMPVRWRLGLLGLAAAVLCGFLLTAPGAGLLARMADGFGSLRGPVEVTPANWANEERRAHWEAAIRMFLDRPLSGIGAGEFNQEYRQYTPEWRFRVGRGHAHNGYLHLAAESGLPGLLAFVAWCTLVSGALIGRIRRPGTDLELMLAVGAGATFVAFMVHSMVDYLNVLSLGIQIALVIALGMACFSTERVASRGRGQTVRKQIAAHLS